MSSSVSSTSNSSSSSFPKNFVLSYEMKFKIFNKDLLKKQINKFNKIMDDKHFDFSFKFNNYSPSFLLLPFLKKIHSFNTSLVKKNKIDDTDYFQVLELIRQIKTKMFRSIEKNYLEHGILENLDVNLSESTNDLLDQLFNPEEFNKILNNKPMAEIFKTNYINPPELDVKEIFITKDDEITEEESDNEIDQHDKQMELIIERNDYQMKYKEAIKENEKLKEQNTEFTKLITSTMAEKSLLEQENKKLNGNRSYHDKLVKDIIDKLKTELQDMTRDRNNYKTLCDGFSQEAEEKMNYLKFYLLKSSDKKDYHFEDLMKILESKLLAKKECLTCDVREMIKENKKYKENKKI